MSIPVLCPKPGVFACVIPSITICLGENYHG